MGKGGGGLMETIKRMIDDARGHLKAARNQMIASDDRIICDHVKDATGEPGDCPEGDR